MRKKMLIVFLLLLTLNISSKANAEIFVAQGVKEGIYNLNDLKLTPGSKYNVSNESNSDSVFILVFDSQDRISQAVILEPRITSSLINPLKVSNRVVVIGKGTVSFIL